MNMSINTQTLEEAISIANSVIAQYEESMNEADTNFTALNSVWNDDQYQLARERFNESKRYINAVIEALRKMQTDFRNDVEATTNASNAIKGIWG